MKQKRKVTPKQRIGRLLTGVRRKLQNVKNKEEELRAFEDEAIPAFNRWIADAFKEQRDHMWRLDQEIEDLEIAIDDLRNSVMDETTGDPLARIEEALASLEELKSNREKEGAPVDTEEGSDPATDSDEDFEPEEIPEFILEEMFEHLMQELRGIDVYAMEPEDFEAAFNQFTDAAAHAQAGDRTAFEKAIARVGADTSDEHVSAVKKTYRKIARNLHPDRNPRFNEDAKLLWNELVKAKEALDLSSMQRIDMQWRVITKDSFEEDEESKIRDFSSEVSEQLARLKAEMRHYHDHPMWGKPPGAEPPKEIFEEIEHDLAIEIEIREMDKCFLLADIDELRRLAKRKSAAKKKTARNKAGAPKKAVKKKTVKKKAAKQAPAAEQMTFDF